MRSPPRVPALLTAAGLVLAGLGTGGPAAAQERTPQSQKAYLQALKGTVWVVMSSQDKDSSKAAYASGVLLDAERKLVVTTPIFGTWDKIAVLFAEFDKAEPVNDAKVYENRINKEGGIPAKLLVQDDKRYLSVLQIDSVPAGAQALRLAAGGAKPDQRVDAVGTVTGNQGQMWGYSPQQVTQTYRRILVSKGKNQPDLDIDAHMLESQYSLPPPLQGGPVVNNRAEVVGIIAQPPGDVTRANTALAIDVSEVRVLLASKEVRAQAGPAGAKAKPAADKPADKPAADKPADDADRAERAAARKLKTAQELVEDGKLDRAKEVCEQLISQYPKTKAAEEAKKLIEKLDK